ncbi:MAG: Loki-CTERM sorting domain-containing protein [Candidatus Hodarchaeales archaeon]|jgi:hypothetical protein
MKKTNLIYIIGIGFLLFLPFIRVSVAAPPAWVGLHENDTYQWQYNNHTAEVGGAWTTDMVSLAILDVLGHWVGPWTEDMQGYGNTGIMSHEIDTIGDLGPDLEYGSMFQSVEIVHAMTWNYTEGGDLIGPGPGGYTWDDKVTMTNIWNGLIIENATEFAWWHGDLTLFFDAFSWQVTTLWVNPLLNWSEAVAAANVGLAASNASAAVVTGGFKITIAAGAWFAWPTSLAIGLEVTFDECGLLDTWDLTYGNAIMMDVDQVAGSQCAPTLPPGIPGFELPIIIGVASIISLILIKKIKKK